MRLVGQSLDLDLLHRKRCIFAEEGFGHLPLGVHFLGALEVTAGLVLRGLRPQVTEQEISLEAVRVGAEDSLAGIGGLNGLSAAPVGFGQQELEIDALRLLGQQLFQLDDGAVVELAAHVEPR